MWLGLCGWEEAHQEWEVHSVLLLMLELCPAPACSAQHTPPEGKCSMREQKQQKWEKWPITILEKAGSMSGCVAGTPGSSSPWLWFINTTLIFVHIWYFCGKYIKNVSLFIRCWPVWLRLCCRRITNSSKSIQLIKESSSGELCR